MNVRFTQLAGVSLLCVLIACDRTEVPDTLADTATLRPEVVPPDAGLSTTADTVRVNLTEWTVRPATDTLRAGRTVFVVSNQGKYEHALEVEGGGMEEETDKIRPGQTATLEVDLKAGTTYELYCPVEDTHGKHERLGMRTAIVVRR